MLTLKIALGIAFGVALIPVAARVVTLFGAGLIWTGVGILKVLRRRDVWLGLVGVFAILIFAWMLGSD